MAPGRLFSAASPWNTPIPQNPVVDSGSAAMVGTLASGAHAGIASLYDYGTRIYEATADTPRYPIHCTQPWGTCALQREPGGVPIPSGAVASAGSDHGLSVIDRATGRAYCFWQYNNDHATTSWGAVYDLAGLGDGVRPLCTGSGLPAVAGVIRAGEVKAGVVPHALVFASRFCAGPTNSAAFRYPAGKTDGKYTGAGAVPEGARIQLDPAVNVDAIPGITAGEKAVAHALQTYGAYLGDCGGANMSFGFEDPKGASDPYPTAGLAWDYYGMDHIPWNRLRVLRQWNGN